MAFDDDGGGGLSARLVVDIFEDGQYQIDVRDLRQGTGQVQLIVRIS